MKKEYKKPYLEKISIDETDVLCASKVYSGSSKGGKSRGSYGKKVDDALK